MDSSRIIEFTVIYNYHKKGLYNYVFMITRSTMVAEDIVHNTFIKLYDNYETINEKEKLERWLFATARNEAMGYFRKIKVRGEEDLEITETMAGRMDPGKILEDKETGFLIERELKEMEPGQSEVFRLKELSEMSYNDIAETLEITEELVKSRLFKARKKLKEALKHLL
ncbi:MAG: sigma-70 family RNA polymerase sigma factor [Ignavibacteriaceae bacterium]|nr:sigma-70 family RNA polymerase sigma factor [Ignavibacteriaceae bacterium]